MTEIESLIFLLGAAALLAQLARMVNVPYPIFLVLGGLGIGFVPGMPEVEIAPEVIFIIFLPPLLSAAAFFASPLELRAHLRPILLLAIGLVLCTTAAIALVAHFLIDLPWAAAFVLGAILAPTDPVAAEAVFRRLGVPGRVSREPRRLSASSRRSARTRGSRPARKRACARITKSASDATPPA